MPNKLDSSFQISRGHNKSIDRVQTNINNLTSDFELGSPLSNNNNHVKRNNANTNNESKTIDIKKGASGILDCSTLSTHSINEINSKSRPMSKA